jgi:hypothetical protein
MNTKGEEGYCPSKLEKKVMKPATGSRKEEGSVPLGSVFFLRFGNATIRKGPRDKMAIFLICVVIKQNENVSRVRKKVESI